MGLSSRIYLVNDDESLKRLSVAKLERLHREDPDERLPQYAGKRVRYVHAVLEMLDRKPVGIIMIQYSYLSFDPEGRLDAAELEKEARLAMDVLLPIAVDQEKRKVINAKYRFAKKRFEESDTWKPSEKVRTAIMEAILRKHRS